MTKQEAKVSTFFLAGLSGGLLSGGFTRLLSHGHAEGGSVTAIFLGTLLLIFSVLHVGLED